MIARRSCGRHYANSFDGKEAYVITKIGMASESDPQRGGWHCIQKITSRNFKHGYLGAAFQGWLFICSHEINCLIGNAVEDGRTATSSPESCRIAVLIPFCPDVSFPVRSGAGHQKQHANSLTLSPPSCATAAKVITQSGPYGAGRGCAEGHLSRIIEFST